MIPAAILCVLFTIPVTAGIAVWRQPPAQRRRLALIVGVALTVRLIIAMVLDASGAWQITGRGAVTPDEATTDLAARLLVNGHDGAPIELGGSLHTSWLLVSWALYEFVWNDLLVMKLVNAVLGALLVVPSYLLARELHSEHAARLAGWTVALFPTALVWSALALRETFLALLLTTLVLLAVRLPDSPTALAAWIVGAAVCLVLLAFTRSYMAPLCMGIVVACAALRRPLRARVRSTGAATMAVILAVGMMWSLPTGQELVRTTMTLVTEPAANIYNPLSDCERSAECPTVPDPRSAASNYRAEDFPGAALGTGPRQTHRQPGAWEPEEDQAGGSNELDASLHSVAQKGTVRAVAIAILAGRPVWLTTEFFFLLQPGVVLWWTMLPTFALGATVLARRRSWSALLATLGYAVAVVIFLAYTGQGIRHHFMFETVGIVLAAVGIAALRDPAISRRARFTTLWATAIMAVGASASVVLSVVSGGT